MFPSDVCRQFLIHLSYRDTIYTLITHFEKVYKSILEEPYRVYYSIKLLSSGSNPDNKTKHAN